MCLGSSSKCMWHFVNLFLDNVHCRISCPVFGEQEVNYMVITYIMRKMLKLYGINHCEANPSSFAAN